MRDSALSVSQRPFRVAAPFPCRSALFLSNKSHGKRYDSTQDCCCLVVVVVISTYFTGMSQWAALDIASEVGLVG